MVLRTVALEAERRSGSSRLIVLPEPVPALGSFVPIVNLPLAIDRPVMRS